MPGDEDDYEYTTTDVAPREPDKFEKGSNDTRESDDPRDGDIEVRERK